MKFKIDILKNSRKIRYVVFFVELLFIVLTIELYTNNYLWTINSIQERQNEYSHYREERLFMEKFVLPHKWSDLDILFVAHEANITFAWENIIRFEDDKVNETKKLNPELVLSSNNEQIIMIRSPKESWNHFISQKLSRIDF